jgi:hypothetical protein
LLFLSVFALAAFSACARAESKPNIEHMLATAKTASDHEAIAQYYENEAADAHAEYEEHQAVVARALSPKSHSWSLHCARLAQDFKQAEEDASVLATEQRKIAEEIKSGAGTSAADASAEQGQ